ncbi:helix-turn-helix domain-containing protein [Ignisphaera cupida]|uniref:helix-turn-helix domain-containing protein n=1 Tax=Ignisphaera cupida TaxID=3050454 RepID=UPI0033070BD8
MILQPKNIAFIAKSLLNCVKDIVHEIAKSYTLSILTRRELEILLKAYETGYILAPRRSRGLKKLSQLLGLSKLSIYVTLRKAINKIIEEVIM